MSLRKNILDYFHEIYGKYLVVDPSKVFTGRKAFLKFYLMLRKRVVALPLNVVVEYPPAGYHLPEAREKSSYVLLNLKTFLKNGLTSFAKFDELNIKSFFHDKHLYIYMGYTYQDEEEGVEPLWMRIGLNNTFQKIFTHIYKYYYIHGLRRRHDEAWKSVLTSYGLTFRAKFVRIATLNGKMYISVPQGGPHYSTNSICPGHLIPALAKNTRDGNFLSYYYTLYTVASTYNESSVYNLLWHRGKTYYPLYQTHDPVLYQTCRKLHEQSRVPHFMIYDYLLSRIYEITISRGNSEFWSPWKRLYPELATDKFVKIMEEFMRRVLYERFIPSSVYAGNEAVAMTRVAKAIKSFSKSHIMKIVETGLFTDGFLRTNIFVSEKLMYYAFFAYISKTLKREVEYLYDYFQENRGDAEKVGLRYGNLSKTRMVWASLVQVGKRRGWLPNRSYTSVLPSPESWDAKYDRVATYFAGTGDSEETA
jgi:hypothetical protein